MRPKGRRGGAALSRLYTVGHSTRSLSELVELLGHFGVTQLVDVRHYPRSRRNPQFNLERLESELPGAGIVYVWKGDTLGGLRKGGYVAYMETAGFKAGLDELETLVRRRPTAIMCAEAAWSRCHRRFIARQMVARGYRVEHIATGGKSVNEETLPGDASHQ
jgi:uncharacterized protein (DUF488 family)